MQFGVSTLVRSDERGDHWHNKPCSFDHTKLVLMMNGYDEDGAEAALHSLNNNRQDWILVNDKLQIC